RVITSMNINSTAPILLSHYIAAGQEQDVQQKALRGTTQNDILKEYIARNTYIYPPEASLRLAVDLIEYCALKMPHWHPISVSGYHIRESGANAVQELAFCFSNAIEYVETAIARGLRVDDFAPQLSFFFACRNDFLEEIAKFRAARRIWAGLMRKRFRARNRIRIRRPANRRSPRRKFLRRAADENHRGSRIPADGGCAKAWRGKEGYRVRVRP